MNRSKSRHAPTRSSPPTGTGGAGLGRTAGRDGRDTFGSAELAIVLSHYDLGVVEAVEEFARGSRRAPKLVIRSQRGDYLLKRRAAGRDDPFKVAFSHQLQLYLTSMQFPLPRLIGTRRENNSMLQWDRSIYELFEFVKGTGYDSSQRATGDAGRTLARFHRLLRGFPPDYEPAAGSYHGSAAVTKSMQRIPRTLARVEIETDMPKDEIDRLLRSLQSSYEAASRHVDDLGLPHWPGQIVHCDWHPGNMLFRGERVAAVIDYDSARIAPRIIDIANGALQFSIIGGDDDAGNWPDHVDESRFGGFLRGYESVPDCVLSSVELKAIPWLMIEALIAESAIPIANTGTFVRIKGTSFLSMVERKVQWLTNQADQLIGAVADGT